MYLDSDTVLEKGFVYRVFPEVRPEVFGKTLNIYVDSKFRENIAYYGCSPRFNINEINVSIVYVFRW